MMYDYYEKDDKIRLSHLKSFYNNEKFNVINCIDSSEEKLELVKKKYGDKINCYKSFTPEIKKTDIYVLSSLPEVNKRYFYEISKYEDSFFLIEKPGWKINELDNISILNKKIYFNYFRKAIPSFKVLKSNFEKKKFGQIQSVNCYYTKGLKNNGSHLIDLIFYFFGNNMVIESLKVTNSIIDYKSNDKTLSFSFKIKYNQDSIFVNFIGLNERICSIIEMDIMTELSRISITDFGDKIIYEEVGEDKLFKGYKKYTNKKHETSDLSNYGNFLAEHLYDIYFEKIKNDSSINNENNISQFIDLIKKVEDE